jgi:hypothetical protein
MVLPIFAGWKRMDVVRRGMQAVSTEVRAAVQLMAQTVCAELERNRILTEK